MTTVPSRTESEYLINLSGLIGAIVRGTWLVLVCGLAGATGLGIRAWLETPVYRAEAVISFVDEAGGGVAGLMDGELGAIATLAGLDIGGSTSRRAEYLALLTSNTQIGTFIQREGVMPLLFSRLWDSESSSWRGAAGQTSPPPMEDAIERFKSDVLRVTTDRQSGLVTVRVEWQDPELPAQWISSLIDQINDQVRETVIWEAEESIRLLNDELSRISTIEIRQGINRLIESYLRTIVVAKAQSQYAIKIIDPPAVSDSRRFVKPRLALETILGAVLGCLIGAIIAAAHHSSLWWPSSLK